MFWLSENWLKIVIIAALLALGFVLINAING